MKRKSAPGQTVTEVSTAGVIHLSGMETSSRLFTMVCSRLFGFIMFMAIMALGAATETSCQDEGDCPPHQFCYDVSNICVHYTNCSQYNREEGAEKAQNPSQCGKCLEGYASNTVATGEEEPVCKSKVQLPVDPPVIDDNSQWWIYMASGIPCVSIVGLLIYFLRKRLTDGDEKWFKTIGTWKFTPSAPPQENAYHLQQPFYTDEEPPIYSAVITSNNNNNNVKERLVNAMPTTPPSWVQVDPSYDEEDGTVNTSGSTAISTTIEVEDEETTPSSWTPENVSVQVPSRPFLQFAPEQRDNVLNAVLVRGDCGSNSTPQDATPEPSPESREGARGNTYRGPNVQINQMITLNMVKSDH
ncbi:uncharacterized protein LOC107045455 isoform X2 [Diachasma alloeum]|uniref:uncharacterized protein LOC107045455 isoform X2 n=1 Tax=Diachasma alloeum TaxID=454923 RepID=UPI0007382047|nr:uncharacterized protein LOC107045455 isoform X2 [Diachasma alloeum]